MRLLILSIVLLAVLPPGAASQVPAVINYQGRLTDSTGVPVQDGSYDMRFRIWTTPEGIGLQLWDSGLRKVAVIDGLFTYELGSAVELPATVFNFPDRYLGIEVGDAPEITPRPRLCASPYALHARMADTAGYALSSPCPVVWEANTATDTTITMGPDQAKVRVWFDSSFTRPPLVFVTVALRMDNSGMTRGSILHGETEVFADHFKVKVYTRKDGAIMVGAAVDVNYLALQVGP